MPDSEDTYTVDWITEGADEGYGAWQYYHLTNIRTGAMIVV